MDTDTGGHGIAAVAPKVVREWQPKLGISMNLFDGCGGFWLRSRLIGRAALGLVFRLLSLGSISRGDSRYQRNTHHAQLRVSKRTLQGL